jgi:hypothetical protein
MSSGPEHTAMARGPRTIAVLALCAFGFGLTLYVFYPGVMTFDARYVYGYIVQRDELVDWQSPLMTLLWAMIDPIAPGSGSMFLLDASLYWLAFTLLALRVARRSWLALALPLLAISPPAFVLVGIIWRDVLFTVVWLLAAALVFVAQDRSAISRYLIQSLALVLLSLGVLLRPNALTAAPILAAFFLWPARFKLMRTLAIYGPALAFFYVLVPVVYYNIIGAKKVHPLHSIIVFDLGGISHFAKQNQFPVSWTPAEAAMVTEQCYNPLEWNFYWNMGPCQFVMRRLEADKIFGTPVLSDAWRRAVMNHPIAYLQHRMTFMETFLAKSNLAMWTYDLNDTTKIAFVDNAALMKLKAIHDVLQPTFLFRQGTWLLLCLGLCGLAWQRRDTPEGAFVLGVCGSGVVYVATYFVLGVASDYRYSYWAVLGGMAGVVVLLPRVFARGTPTALSDTG